MIISNEGGAVMHVEYLIGIDSMDSEGRMSFCQVNGYPMIMRSKDMAKLARDKNSFFLHYPYYQYR